MKLEPVRYHAEHFGKLFILEKKEEGWVIFNEMGLYLGKDLTLQGRRVYVTYSQAIDLLDEYFRKKNDD